MKYFRVLNEKQCTLDFLTRQDQETLYMPVGTIIGCDEHSVWAWLDGKRRETINYPHVIDLYVGRGHCAEIHDPVP